MMRSIGEASGLDAPVGLFSVRSAGPSDAPRASERVSPAMAQEPLFSVARGPVPRDHWGARGMARDRPSPYGEGGAFLS